MPEGRVEQIVQKATQKGQKYYTLLINDGHVETWGSFWGTPDFDKGDDVEYEVQKKGQYTNYNNVRKVSGSGTGSAGSGVAGRADRGAKDRAITKMAVTRTAAQMLTPFAPGKKETPADRLITLFNLAEALEAYVYGEAPAVKTPPASMPTLPEKPDDSEEVFPTE